MEHPIKRLCRARGITQKAVAEEVGYTPTFISDLIHGREKCGREAALRFWRTYGLDLEELLTWEGPGRPSEPAA